MFIKHNVLLINGPNINLLGYREIDIYGKNTLHEVINKLKKKSIKLKINLKHFQSNSESRIIKKIHNANKNVHFIIINPASLTHTSISLRDALLGVNIPFIEIHISNIYNRDKFRTRSYISDIAYGIICGFGTNGYFIALEEVEKILSCKNL
ncbi:type II 3-dehydroquinate dehydratase [Buchnera aphidicola (Taiwanaphis decaspermi)]|uniref:type II 3-dehydroquinate dehydratase n=1 Tax=Buchnera aphidicola TaxID=9 RepID=UPI0031B8A1F2